MIIKMENMKQNPNNSEAKAFPRWLLFVLGAIFTLVFLEFNVLQIFKSQLPELELFYGLSHHVFFLVIPFMAFVVVPLIDRINHIANKRVIFIRLNRNSVYARRFDIDVIYGAAAEFSQQTEIVADADSLAKAVSVAFRECTRDNKFAISPVVVFTASEKLSTVQVNAALQAIRAAGALSVKYMGDCVSDSDAMEFARQNPYSTNFA